VTLSEVLATSDVPGGVINVLTGRTAEVAPWLAAHADVNGIDLAGAAEAEGLSWADLERAAADNLKRVLRPDGAGAAAVEPDWATTPDTGRLRAWLETKTVWHPKGS
jgi:acyl-CoA reductase-like NAD-dependent aldehyde dehydrogenase